MIFVLGLNHKTAPQQIREKLALSEPEGNEFSEEIINDSTVEEIVTLSTCNRTEIYFSVKTSSEKDTFDQMLEKLLTFKHMEEISTEYFYNYSGEKAVKHLFAVCAGMDSMVVGEDQIIGQVKDAYQVSTENGNTGPCLNRLFQKAFEAGKRVRTETNIKSGATSVSHVAVDVCKAIFCSLAGKTALVLGAGQAASLIAESLHKQNIGKLYIANRTFSRAESLAEKYDANPLELDQIGDYLETCDCIISATSAERIIISSDDALKALSRRDQRMQVYVDISVPHNLDKKIKALENTKMYIVDDLDEIVRANTAKRMQCLGPAEEIIDEVAEEYLEWYASRALQPAIQTITDSLKKIGQDEAASFPGNNRPEMAKLMSEYNQYLMLKYTRHFIKNLKQMSKDHKDVNYIDMVNDLFRISG